MHFCVIRTLPVLLYTTLMTFYSTAYTDYNGVGNTA